MKIEHNSCLLFHSFFRNLLQLRRNYLDRKPFFGMNLKVLTTFQMQMGGVKGQAGEEEGVIQFQKTVMPVMSPLSCLPHG